MKKTELIEAVAKSTGQPKTVVTKVIDATFDETVSVLKRGEDLSINGFGRYQAPIRAARAGRNPRTGESVQIAERKVVTFKPADAVLDRLNQR